MKAVFLLLCLACARGNIFHRGNYPEMKTIIFDSLPYVDQLQQRGYLHGNSKFLQNIEQNTVQSKEAEHQKWNQIQEPVLLAQYEQEQQMKKKDESQSYYSSNERSQEIKGQPKAIQDPQLQEQQGWDQPQESDLVAQWEQGLQNQDRSSSNSILEESIQEIKGQPKTFQNPQLYDEQRWNQPQESALKVQWEQGQQNQEKDKIQTNSISNDSTQDTKGQLKASSRLNEQEKEDRAQKPGQFAQRDQLKSDMSQNSIENSQDIKEQNFENSKKEQLESLNVNSALPLDVHQHESNLNYGDAAEWNSIKMAAYPNTIIRTQDAMANIFLDTYNTKNIINDETRIKFHEAYEAAAQANSEDTQLNATQLLNKYQYEAEQHVVKTEDGYILTLIHISPKRMHRDVQKRPVVFLMHGLLGSADDWLLMGPGKSLGYLLADVGYDVWMGNARGNKYSRRHVWIQPVLPEFWQFSNDEISLIDLPAMIDYVLTKTNQDKMFYIGYSQGTTNFFALASTRPEYNAKVTMMYALAPMAYMSNVRSPMLRMIAPTSHFEELLQRQLGKGEFKPNKEVIKTLGGNICEQQIGCRNVCSNVIFTISGVNIEGLDPTLLPVILNHLPAGTSSKLMRHYAQGVASLEFRRFDYGPQINNEVYGELQPPKYELKNVTVPISMYWSEEDWLATPKDLEKLQKELPSVQDSYKVPNQHFSHLDFLLSALAPELVYERLLNSIQQNLL